jgi:mediator of RNA polymerase II transcription subunit 6
MSKDPPLDEIQWRSPELVASFPGGGIHENTVLHYFAASPFFDATSNNRVLTLQAESNPHMMQFVDTRAAMEEKLRTMSGLEYMVAEAPAEMGPGMGTGVWVIRKQTRRKAVGGPDEITIHQTYFVVGEHVYQAPTLGDVLASRLVRCAYPGSLPSGDGRRC